VVGGSSNYLFEITEWIDGAVAGDLLDAEFCAVEVDDPQPPMVCGQFGSTSSGGWQGYLEPTPWKPWAQWNATLADRTLRWDVVPDSTRITVTSLDRPDPATMNCDDYGSWAKCYGNFHAIIEVTNTAWYNDGLFRALGYNPQTTEKRTAGGSMVRTGGAGTGADPAIFEWTATSVALPAGGATEGMFGFGMIPFRRSYGYATDTTFVWLPLLDAGGAANFSLSALPDRIEAGDTVRFELSDAQVIGVTSWEWKPSLPPDSMGTQGCAPGTAICEIDIWETGRMNVVATVDGISGVEASSNLVWVCDLFPSTTDDVWNDMREYARDAWEQSGFAESPTLGGVTELGGVLSRRPDGSVFLVPFEQYSDPMLRPCRLEGVLDAWIEAGSGGNVALGDFHLHAPPRTYYNDGSSGCAPEDTPPGGAFNFPRGPSSGDVLGQVARAVALGRRVDSYIYNSDVIWHYWFDPATGDNNYASPLPLTFVICL
jgi:hypothetical protein